jgi:hypothetical protein
VRLPADGDPVSVRVSSRRTRPGPRVFRLKVAPQAGEVVTQNNQRDVQIDVPRSPRAYPLLRRGAALRAEVRAAGDQRRSRTSSSSRWCGPAENKHFPLRHQSPEELVAGFPKTREELFEYRGIVLGSVEASAFTADQLRMIAEFRRRRGGGLLVLGGGRSFAEGGYAGTPIAEVLPVTLQKATRGSRT